MVAKNQHMFNNVEIQVADMLCNLHNPGVISRSDVLINHDAVEYSHIKQEMIECSEYTCYLDACALWVDEFQSQHAGLAIECPPDIPCLVAHRNSKQACY